MSKKASPRGKSRSVKHMGGAVTVSACLIVRDEEENLERCLTSIVNSVDEIVVVDTGCTDGTMAVAARFGAKTFAFPWCDDFSAPRNESLLHATGKWVLYIDADEELLEARPHALRELCGDLEVSECGAELTIDCPADEEGLSGVVGEQWRLLRNNVGIHFEGRVHEQLRAAGEPTLRAAGQHGVQLRHWGYVPKGDLLQRKGERNRKLLKLAIDEEPGQPAHLFHLGRQYAWEQDFAAALPVLEQAIALWRGGPQPADGYVPSMFSTAALCASRLGRYDQVLRMHADTPERFVSSELLYVAGVASWKLGQIDQAIARLTAAWQDTSLAKSTGLDPSTAGWRPLSALSEIYAATGRIEDARRCLTAAIELSPERDDLRQQLERLDGPAPLLSACMIVRDEAENLRRWLPAVRAAVDEVIVVDTGSTDTTAAIAAELGAQVHHFPWQDDFAAARNESLRHARGAWIMWIDADDELVERTPAALRELCSSTAEPAIGCWVACESVTSESGEVGARLQQLRLFRNGRDIRFRGRIHEQPLLPEGVVVDQVVRQDSVHIRHWGYVPQGELLNQKAERNRRLLQLSLADEPEEVYHHYTLGKQHVWEHDYLSALAVLQRGIGLWEAQGRVPRAYLAPMFAAAACAALNLGQNQLALDIEQRCPDQAVSSDLLYYSAIACHRTGRAADAVTRLTRAFGDPSVGQASETDPATSTWQPRLLLGQIYMELNQRDDAYRYAMEALDLMPDRLDILFSGASLAASMNQPHQAARLARRILAAREDNGYKARAERLLLDLGVPA